MMPTIAPIPPTTRPFLEAVWDEAKEGEVRIFSRYTDVRINLRTQFNRWILRTGLEPRLKPVTDEHYARATGVPLGGAKSGATR